jgi:hypothetical protein
VGIKGYQQAGAAMRHGLGHHRADNAAMTPMHAIKISDKGAGTMQFPGQGLMPANNCHHQFSIPKALGVIIAPFLSSNLFNTAKQFCHAKFEKS